MFLLNNILGVFCAIDLFVWWRSIRNLGRTVHWGVRMAVHCFFTAQLGVVAAICWTVYRRDGTHIPASVLSVTLIWHLIVAPLTLVGNLLGMTVQAVAGFFRYPKPKPAAPSLPGSEKEGLSRRDFLGTVATLIPPVLTFSLGSVAAKQLGKFRIRRLTLTIPNLPAALDGMTIAHLTDLHVGQLTKGRVLRKIVAEANKLEADLMLFTGDLINSDLGFLPAALETLRALRPQPVLCEGNHDVGSDRGGFESGIQEAGFTLLLDETVSISVRGVPVQLLGIRWEGPHNLQNRHDESGLAASMRTVLQQRDPAAFPILLAHHPHAWDYCGDIPLTLSGHTHGGQLMLNDHQGFGPWMFRYWTGLYSRPATPAHPAQTLLVNNGIGNWFPLRTAAPAEIVHLTLRRG
ncbi:MAG: metallophosphoesterase [Verrucomicrobiota bacterium]